MTQRVKAPNGPLEEDEWFLGGGNIFIAFDSGRGVSNINEVDRKC